MVKQNDANEPRSKKNTKRKEETVFVTGGNGRLGRELIKTLIQKGDTVRALVRNKESVLKLPSGVIPYVGDLNNSAVLDEACKDVDTVFHFAAIVSQYRLNTKETIKINSEGTNNILKACNANNVNKLIFSSSIDVYGRDRKEVLTEESETRPDDKYGYSKILAEEAIKVQEGHTKYTIFRFSTIYGPGYENSFFKVFKALYEKKAYIIGNGSNHLALLNVYDALQAMLLAQQSEKGKNQVYNVSDGTSYTQEYLLKLVSSMLEVEMPNKFISPFILKMFAKRQGFDPDEVRFLTSDRVINIDKIKKELGFKPKVGIKDGAQELVNRFLNKNPKYIS